MAELNVNDVSLIEQQIYTLARCVEDIENITEVVYADGSITVDAADLSAAKTRANSALSTLQTDVAALSAYV
jgi:hypothetical protein